MKWVLIGLAVVVGLVVVTLIGAFLPREHTASRAIALHQPPDTVWAAIRDLGGTAAWWGQTKSVERADAGGKEVWIQSDRHGSRLTVEIVEERRPTKLVTRIVTGPRAPFGGTWTYDVVAAPGGARLMVTERGWIAVPPFRVFARLMGLDATIRSYLTALAKKFGEAPAIE